MWALGVVLYTMLYGQFPFYDSVPHELFRKIKSAEFIIPGYAQHSLKQKVSWLNLYTLFCTILVSYTLTSRYSKKSSSYSMGHENNCEMFSAVVIQTFFVFHI